jgi:hypothetical protein
MRRHTPCGGALTAPAQAGGQAHGWSSLSTTHILAGAAAVCKSRHTSLLAGASSGTGRAQSQEREPGQFRRARRRTGLRSVVPRDRAQNAPDRAIAEPGRGESNKGRQGGEGAAEPQDKVREAHAPLAAPEGATLWGIHIPPDGDKRGTPRWGALLRSTGRYPLRAAAQLSGALRAPLERLQAGGRICPAGRAACVRDLSVVSALQLAGSAAHAHRASNPLSSARSTGGRV